MNWEKTIHESDAWARDKPALKGEINKGRGEEPQETWLAIGHFGNT